MMKGKFKAFHFQNLSFRRKVICICLAVSMVPILLLGVFSYQRLYTQLVERENLALQETLRQETDSINYKMDSYLNALNLVAWNENVIQTLIDTYSSNFDMYLAYRDTIDPLFLTVRSINTDISYICIYTEHNIYPHGSILRSLEEAKEFPWYEQARQSSVPVFQISEDQQVLYLACKIYDSRLRDINIVCLSIDMNTTLRSSTTLFEENYGFLLIDSKGNPIYEYYSFSDSEPLSAEFLFSDTSFPNYVVEKKTLNNAGWTSILYRPLTEVTSSAFQISLVVVFIILICLILILITSSFFSQIIVSPLEELSANMEQVEQGNYEISVTNNSQDEVGKLFHAFQKMVQNLNHLINEVLRAKIEQQKYELHILQLQINPHFLYNSLSLINSKAIMAGQEDISQLSQLLSTFYRTMLNKGRVFLSVQTELENVKAYIRIQQIMHSNSFEVLYDIDEKALSCQVPNLILQPLAENAILHGLDCKETPGKGMLTISCSLEDNDILFNVMDNGCGIGEEDCARILSSDSKGYGVKNVHQRIQLYYGEKYGISYRTTKGYGTCASLRLGDKLPK